MPTASQRTMRFLGRSYMAFVLTPEGPIIEWLAQLDGWLARSPGFFGGRAVVLVTHLERAELYVEQFAARGLPATIEPV